MKRVLGSLVVAGLLLVAGAAALGAADETGSWKTTLKVKVALLEKLGADALKVDVDSYGDEVRLGGTVSKRETAELAETVAKSVEGVRVVQNDLRLSSAPSATTEAEAEVKDGLLETKVRLALIDKLGRDGFRIGTEAASGVVTLEFPADLTSARRSEATEVTQAVQGVKKVVGVEKR